MTKQARKTGKRTLALLMTVLMLMSAWVFVAPTASAMTSQTAGSYKTRMGWHHPNANRGMTHNATTVTISGIKNNGRVTATSGSFDLSKNALDPSASNNNTYGSEVTMDGFPTKLGLNHIKSNNGTYEARLYIDFEVYNYRTSSWNTIASSYQTIPKKNYLSDVSADSSSYPDLYTVTYSGAETVYTTGSTQKTYSVETAKDQYGVNWGFTSVSWSSDNSAATINNSGVATFGLNGGTPYDVTFTATLNHSSGNKTASSGITVHVIPCKALSLNTAETVKQSDSKYYCFTPSASGDYVFFSYDTDNTPDPKLIVNEFDNGAVGTLVGSNDDIGDVKIRELLSGSTSNMGSYSSYVVANLNAGTTYLVHDDRNSSSETYPMKVCKAVEITFDPTGGPSTLTKTLPAGHTLHMNQTGISRANHTLIAWTTKYDQTQLPKTCMSSETITIPSSETTYYALWNPSFPTPMTLNIDCQVSIDTDYEVEYLEFTPAETHAYVIYSHNQNCDPFGILINKSDWETSASILQYSDDDGDGNNFKITAVLQAGVTYLIGAKLYDDGTGSMDVRVEEAYTVHYDANGGSGAPEDQVKLYDVNLTLSSTEPTRTGYTFLGWSTHASSTTADYQAGATYSANADATLYAVWQIHTSTLTVDPNGGTWNYSPENQSFTQSYGTTKTIANPVKAGYSFGGWTRTNNYGQLSGTTYTFGATNNVTDTLTATWNKADYSVSYTNANAAGSATTTGTGTFTDTITVSGENHLTGEIVVKSGTTVLESSQYTFDPDTGALSVPAANVLGNLTIDAKTASHTYNYVKIDDTNHKQVCTVCGYEKIASEAHESYWVKDTEASSTVTTATCHEEVREVYYCSKCGDRKVESQPKDTHNWVEDSTKSTPATCQGKGKLVEVCSKCHDERTTDIPQLSHNWEESASSYALKSDATCMTPATYYKSCSLCHTLSLTETFTVGTTIPHSFAGTATTDNNGHHGQYCEYGCGTISPTMADCTYGAPVVVTAPTCTEDGVSKETCSACGYVHYFTTEASGHNFNGAAVSDGNGNHAYKCANCDTYGYMNGTTPVVGYEACDSYYGAPESISGTYSCISGAATQQICAECGYKKITTGDTGSHSYPDTWTEEVAATCYSEGLETRTCSICGIAKQSRTIPKISHTQPADWTIVVPATCEKAGYKTKTCTVSGCGAILATETIPALSHSFTGEYVYVGGGKHARLCANNCGAIGVGTEAGETENCSGGTATCTVGKICTACGEEYMAPLGHSFTGALTNNNDGTHSVACANGCGTSATEDCNYNVPSNVQATAATCTTPATYYYKCACGAQGTTTYESGSPLNHNFNGAYLDNGNGTHSRLCANGCGTYGDPTGHSFNDVVSELYFKSAADCTTPATYYKSCACGARSTDTFTNGVARGHNYTGAVTSNDNGTHEVACVNGCGTTKTVTCTFNQQIVSTGANGTMLSDATCLQPAKYYLSCACGQHSADPTEIFAIGTALGHQAKSVAPVAPKCNEPGTYTYTWCERCYKVLTINYIDVEADDIDYTGSTPDDAIWTDTTAHNYSDWSVTTPASCTAEGEMTRTCAYCGDVKRQEIPKAGHTIQMVEPVAPKCNEPGAYAFSYCSVCKQVLTINFADVTEENLTYTEGTLPTGAEWVDADAHNYGDWSVTTPASCTAQGEMTCTCAYCGDTDSKVIEALGHEVEPVEAVAATCLNNGYEAHYACTRCGALFSDAEGITLITEANIRIPATGHSFGAWTTTEEGHSRTCQNGDCNETESAAHTWADIVKEIALVNPTSDPCAAGVSYFRSCSVCGYTSTDTSNTFTTKEAGHKLVEVAAKAATCEAAGNIHYWKCAVCGKYYNNADGANEHEITEAQTIETALGHDFDLTATPVEVSGGHMYPCKNCGGYGDGVTLGETEDHSFTESIVGPRYLAGEPVNCGDTTTYYKSCKCGAVGTGTFQGTGTLDHVKHNYAAVAATCAADGNHAYSYCSRCNKYFDSNDTETTLEAVTISKSTVAHTWGANDGWTTLTAATCTEQGSERRECSVCHKVETQTTPALGHEFDPAEGATPVKNNDGTHSFKCKRCDVLGAKIGNVQKLKAEGGFVNCSFGEWQPTDGTDCSTIGSKKCECTVCHYEKIENGSYGAHNLSKTEAVAATCTQPGRDAYWTCSVCGKIFADANAQTQVTDLDTLIVDASGHALTQTPASAADCTKAGNTAYYTCSSCGHYFSDEQGQYEIEGNSWVIPKKDHDYNGVIRYLDETKHEFQCVNGCGQFGGAVNHTYDKAVKEGHLKSAATCTEAATYYYSCVCGASGTETFTVGNPLGHQFNAIDTTAYTNGWKWTKVNDAWTAKATLTCSRCDATVERDAIVTYTTNGATCGAAGSVDYTATVALDSGDPAEATSTKSEEVTQLPHDYNWADAAIEWVKNGDSYTVTATAQCKHDDEEHTHDPLVETAIVTKVHTDPTCTALGSDVYTATFESFPAQTKTDSIPALGHAFNEVLTTMNDNGYEAGWKWTEAEGGGYTAKAMLRCTRADCDATIERDANVTHETSSASCVEGGTINYTAAVMFDDETWESSEKPVGTPTLGGHIWKFDRFEWTGNDTDGYEANKARFVCDNDPKHITFLDATTTTLTVLPRCGSIGSRTYTATVTIPATGFDAITVESYTESKVVPDAALEHNWLEPTYTTPVKVGNHYECTAVRVCSRDAENHRQTEKATPEGVVKTAPKCEETGEMIYTFVFNNTAFSVDPITEVIPATGHKLPLTHVERVEPTCTEGGNIEYWQCEDCGKCFTDAEAEHFVASTAIDALDHDFVMSGSNMVAVANDDNETHSFKCLRCNAYGAKIDGEQRVGGKVLHTYGNWVVTQEATCTSIGHKKRICLVCDYVETDTIPMVPHNLRHHNAKDATCLETGNIDYYDCSSCHGFFTDAAGTTAVSSTSIIKEKLPHSYTGEIKNNGDGTHSFRCVNGCNRFGDGKDHVFTETVEAKKYLCAYADCTHALTYYKSCACGAKGTDTFEVGKALGHLWINYPQQDVTCTQSGHTAYRECDRCHIRENYAIIETTGGHGAYVKDPEKSGGSSDGSIKWVTKYCERGCGDYYMELTITSLDANGTRVPNVNVRITDAANNTVASGQTDANGEYRPDKVFKQGTYSVDLGYVRDGGNYNTHGTIKITDGVITGSTGRLTPYGGNASGSTGGQPTGEFRCSMCDMYDSAKDIPVYGWFISIIHAFVHAISRIGK